MFQLNPYRGYDIACRVGPAPDYANPTAEVRDPLNERVALYRTTNLGAAMKWVDAYVDGQAWAVMAKLSMPLAAPV